VQLQLRIINFFSFVENVAIKMVDKSRLDEKTRRMLNQEISAMERVHHPNVIRLYEVLETYSKVIFLPYFSCTITKLLVKSLNNTANVNNDVHKDKVQ